MLILLGLIVATTIVLGFGSLVAEVFLRRQHGRQDATWRYTLAIVASLPVLVVLRPLVPKQEIAFARVASEHVQSIEPERINARQQNNISVEVDPTRRDLPPSGSTAQGGAKLHQLPNLVDANNTHVSASSLNAMIVIWVFGSMWSLLHLVHGWHLLRRIVAQSTPLVENGWSSISHEVATELAIPSRMIRLTISQQIDSPIVAGILRPVILLPKSFVDKYTDLNQLELRQILAHEMTHVR